MGLGVVEVEGSETVWVAALVACAVRVPEPVPDRTRSHSEPAGSWVGQSCERMNPVVES